jgi:hypothetical protein
MNGDAYVDDPLDRIEVADILGGGERLTELRERVRVEFERIKPEGVVLLGSIARNLSYNAAAERATIETIVRLVAQDLHMPCDRLSPPTVSARLGLRRTGTFGALARAFFTKEHPPFWAERCKAAAAAVAWQRA